MKRGASTWGEAMGALNFNAHARLAEIQNRTALPAKPANSANLSGESTVTPQTLAGLAALAAAPRETAKAHRADPAAWLDALAHIDATCPPAGYNADLWRCLLADARWLCERHGRAAAALGWTASDLFGFDPLPGWGGLADRLEGARKLVLTDRIAHWRSEDCEGWLWRQTLTAKPVIWDAKP